MSKPNSVVWLTAALALVAGLAGADEIDGFTEPYRAVRVAGPETGILTSIPVREGDAVTTGQALAVLDTDVHELLLEIADAGRMARGRLDSALAELESRKYRLEKLVELRARGHGRAEEVERARADVAISEAQVRTAREDRLTRELEFKKIQAQIKRRTIRARLDGVVSRILKEEGEIVTPADAHILTIVELNPLLAKFAVLGDQAQQLKAGEKVTLQLRRGELAAEGIVELVSPVTDAESGTVQVKVRIENAEGLYRAGEPCTLRTPSDRGAVAHKERP